MRSSVYHRVRPHGRRVTGPPRRLYVQGAFSAAPWTCILAFTAFTGTACDRAVSHEPFSLSDSAGVWIAESTLPAWEAGDKWVIEDDPSVVIGTVDGPPETLFSRVAAAWKQPDGRIVVGERSASEGAIRFYDEEGRFLHHVGREGSGPGEFQLLLFMFPYRADSIVAWDPFQSRFTVLDGDGQVGRTEPVILPMDASAQAGDGPLHVQMGGFVGAFSDGTLLMDPDRVMPPEGAPRPLERVFYRYSAEGDSLNPIEPTRHEDARRPGAFAPRSLQVGHGERFYRGAGDEYEIRVQNTEGRLEGIIRASHRDLTVTEVDREAYRQGRRAGLQNDADLAELERELRTLDFPPSFPPYADLRIDSERHAWVGHYPQIGEDVSRLWDVFDPGGRLLGTVETPQGFRLHQIGPDFVVGAYSGELGVPQVRVYPLSR